MRALAWIFMVNAALLSSPVHAAGLEATGNGQAQAEVVAPLIVTREADLAFGALFAGSQAGAVTVSSDGETTYLGGAQFACAPAACASAHPAGFTVQGEAGRSYVVTVPTQITAFGTATDGSGLAVVPLSVSAITVKSASRDSIGAGGQLDSTGRDRFQVGGTLEVPANLAPAQYTAVMPVIVTYG